MMIKSFYKSDNRDFTIVHGDCFDVLPKFDFKFDMIFADPPYFLSNGGISYHAGKVVCVDKGEWDKGGSAEYSALRLYGSGAGTFDAVLGVPEDNARDLRYSSARPAV